MKRLAAAAVLVFATAGCAVPGQVLDPGVALEYGDTVVTQAQVDTIYAAWEHDTEGNDLANIRQVMTLEAMHDSAVAAALPVLEANDIELTPEFVYTLAQDWLRLKGVSGEPSPEVQRQVETAYALYVVAVTSADGTAVQELADAAEAGVVGSPRAGIFDADTFMESMLNALTSAQNQDLQRFSYTTFQDANGFIDPPTTLRVIAPAPA